MTKLEIETPKKVFNEEDPNQYDFMSEDESDEEQKTRWTDFIWL